MKDVKKRINEFIEKFEEECVAYENELIDGWKEQLKEILRDLGYQEFHRGIDFQREKQS